MRYAILGLFVFWLMASVYNHFHASLRRKLWYFDLLFRLPTWTLFRSPSTEDLVLEYRDRLSNGALTEWRAIALGQRSTLFTCLWNPELVADAYLRTRLTRLRDSLLGVKSIDADTHSAYAIVWSAVRAQPRQASVKARQFRLLRGSTVTESPHQETLITSGFQPC